MEEIMNQSVSIIQGYLPKLIGAILILIVGWFLAGIVAGLVRKVLNRIGVERRVSDWLGKDGDMPSVGAGQGIARAVFWLIMILTFVALLQFLNLTLATDPLNKLLSPIFQFIPNLIGAVILSTIAWFVATILRVVVAKGVTTLNLDERLREQSDATDKVTPDIGRALGETVFWLTILLFLPAILGALGLQGLLLPVQAMVDEFLVFLPSIFGALVIAIAGWLIARVLRRITSSVLAAAGVNRLSDRLKMPALSQTAGLLVYILVLVPVFIASLNALELTSITGPASQMLSVVLEAIPAIIAAGLLLALAFFLGRLVMGLVSSFLSGIGFDSVFINLGLQKQSNVNKRRSPSQIVGYLALVATMVFASMEASRLLGFEGLAGLLEEFVAFGSEVLLGLVIFGAGLYLAGIASRTIRDSSARQAPLLASIANVTIIVLAGSIALRQMGLANDIVNWAFLLILAAGAVAFAIAFGIGGRELAARKLEEWSKEINS